MSKNEINYLDVVNYFTKFQLTEDYILLKGREGMKQIFLNDKEFSAVCRFFHKYTGGKKVNAMKLIDWANPNKPTEVTRAVVGAIMDACGIPEDQCEAEKLLAILFVIAGAIIKKVEDDNSGQH